MRFVAVVMFWFKVKFHFPKVLGEEAFRWIQRNNKTAVCVCTERLSFLDVNRRDTLLVDYMHNWVL